MIQQHYQKIYIRSGGKTGSSTLLRSFQNFQLCPVDGTSRRHHTFHHHDGKERVLVITSFRDPITRMISSFFENLSKHIPYFQNVHTFHPSKFEYYYSLCQKKFDSYLASSEYIEAYHPVGCPSRHVDTFFYETKKDANYDILWLRFDNIDKWQTQIASIFPKFKLVSSNQTKKKPYSEFYRYFKERYRNKNFQKLVQHEKNIWKWYMTEHDMAKICDHWSNSLSY